jgi:hypothetical protein
VSSSVNEEASTAAKGVRNRFVSDLTAELSIPAFVARNEAGLADLARNQAGNAGYL